MGFLRSIKERVLPEGIVITNEVIKPVAEKWVDGLVRETDNLQITIRSTSENDLEEIMAYLYYYDSNGKELGHEFDIAESKIKPGGEARVGFILTPPENYTHTKLEFKAEQGEGSNYLPKIAFYGVIFLVVYIFERFW